jgi:hypothetical protein
MANTEVFRGSDATLQLATVTSQGGTLAKAIFDTEYKINTVGRVTGVEVCVETDLEAFHEIGSRRPVNIYPGNINIHGSVQRAYVNGALLRLLLGAIADKPSKDPLFEQQPEFIITLDLTNVTNVKKATPSAGTTVKISGVKFENWNVIVPEDDFVMEKVTFQALGVTREEKKGQ